MDRSHIKVKAYAIFQRKDGHILVNDVRESDGSLIGYRVPGGHVEFGERGYDAVLREIEEELNVPVKDVTFLGMLENMFVYQGKPGHEVIFNYTASFEDESLYAQETIQAYEHEIDDHFTLFWVDPKNPPKGLPIFPDGLAKLL